MEEPNKQIIRDEIVDILVTIIRQVNKDETRSSQEIKDDLNNRCSNEIIELVKVKYSTYWNVWKDLNQHHLEFWKQIAVESAKHCEDPYNVADETLKKMKKNFNLD